MKRHGKKGTKKKSRGPKVSIQKLSNKRLNKLAKQGKLKPKHGSDRKKVLQLVKDRVNPEQQKHLQADDGSSQRPEPEDIPLEEADYEYFSKPGRDFSFLSDSSLREKKSRKRKKMSKDEEEDDIVAKHEKIPRRLPGSDRDIKVLLPIKSKEKGIETRIQDDEEEALVHDQESETENTFPAEDAQESAGETATPLAEPLPSVSTAELFAQRRLKLAERKRDIAVTASTILENPEEGMRKLKELRGFLEESDPDIFLTTRKLAMVSVLEVFKDIIPGYRIRIATEAEKAQAAKKETRALRDYEESLVTNYRCYLEHLEKVVKGKSSKNNPHPKRRQKLEEKGRNGLIIPQEASRGLREIGVKCLCELLVTHPHFNYRTNIISVVVPLAAHSNMQISSMVCTYIKQLFREDKSGEVTLEVVRLIGRIVKAKSFDMKPDILNTFLSLKIKEIDTGEKLENKAERRNKLRKLSRREKKRHKQMKELEKELEEASAASNKDRKLRLNTEIINMIFLTYFRILKTARHSVLLSAVLEGLAKFAHFISIDFFDDLFAVINDLVDSGELTYRESLHCVQTAFTILSGQGAALNIDPTRFYAHLYRTMFQLHAGLTSEDLPIALRCLDVMINKRRKQVSQQRLLAYLKRLCTLMLQLLPHGTLGSLATARGFMLTFPQSDRLLDTESLGSGLFLPELEEPEHCNAHNTALYELHLLRRSYHPTVRSYTSHILCGVPSQGQGALSVELARKTPVELFDEYNMSEMNFKPSIQTKPKHRKKKCLSEPDKSEFVQDVMQIRMKELDKDLSQMSAKKINFYGSFRTNTDNNGVLDDCSDSDRQDDGHENRGNKKKLKKQMTGCR